MASRDPQELTEETRAKYELFSAGMARAKIDFILTCTRRTQADQNELYAQGRTKPGNIVTWTRKSKHIDGLAFDIVIMESGKPDWNIKNKKWARAGLIGKEAGLSWGGSWEKNKDYPHFENV